MVRKVFSKRIFWSMKNRQQEADDEDEDEREDAEDRRGS